MSAPYHYSNHCSNICTVLQYLVRLPPFTQLFVAFQGRFSLLAAHYVLPNMFIVSKRNDFLKLLLPKQKLPSTSNKLSDLSTRFFSVGYLGNRGTTETKFGTKVA